MMKEYLMKFGRVFLLSLLVVNLQGCSSDDTPEPDPKPEPEVQKPVAKDDNYSTGENQEIVMSDLLDNDTIYDYGRIKEFDETTIEGGTVEQNTDGSLTYTPPSDFQGTDTFEYTLCDAELPANCSTAKVTITINDAGEPVAVDDSYEATENKKFNINNFLENDELLDGATFSEVNVEGLNGTVIVNDDGSLSYTSNNGFSGVDTFTYTICDSDETPSCSTATITITVIDEGSPVANPDVVSMAAGESQIVISNVLENDVLTDDAEISSVMPATHGEVTLNADGTITYTAEAGYVGEVTFTYTLCDDDAEPSCVDAEVTVKIVETISFNIPPDLNYYYADVVFSDDQQVLYEELAAHTNENHVNKLEYYTRHDYLYEADEDPNNPDNVILIYSGDSRPENEYWEGNERDEWETFNTEHIYPQSKLGDNEEAKNDMHHMRSADIDVNESRSNHPYTEGNGTYELINGDSWYPGDEWRGDVARMVMYINLKYGEPFSDVGDLQMFLKWNVEDPVSDFELQRQEVIEGAQGNRNPFIDNPYLATLIWGGTPAENKWQ